MKKFCIRTSSVKFLILENCHDWSKSKRNDESVVHDFFETDEHFDFLDIKIGGNPIWTLKDYKPFIERYKKRPLNRIRTLHFSNEFNKSELKPLWNVDYFYTILEELVSVKAPLIVEIDHKLRNYLGWSLEYERIEKILRQHKHIFCYRFFVSLHSQNEWKSWVTEDRQTLRFWIDAESMRYYDKNKHFLFEPLY